jgi:syntaxin 5
LLIPEQAYLEARAQAIEDVESHIVELGSIFNRLANMIAEQRELVERIEDNVDDAHERVTHTRDYLLSVYSRLSSNGPLMLKSFFVLISFIVFFVLFVA